MNFLDKMTDQIGYLVLNEEGAVLSSSGELENDERSANIITTLIQMTDSIDPNVFPNSNCQKITITFDDHSYVICMSNKKIYVVKKKNRRSSNSGIMDHVTEAVN